MAKRWTEEELKLMESKAGECETIEELAALFPDKTLGSVLGKKERLKVALKGQRTEWTEQEKQLLQELYPTCRGVNNIIERFPNRTEQSLWRQAFRMQLKSEYWSDEEVKILIDNTSDHSIDYVEGLLPNKTRSAIVNKTNQMNLRRSAQYRSESQSGSNNNFCCGRSGGQHKEETKEYFKEIWQERKKDVDWIHPWVGRNHSEETKLLIGNKSKLYYEEHEQPMKGKQHTEQSRQNMRVPHVMSPEGSQRLRESVMSRPHFMTIEYVRRNGETVWLDSGYELEFAKSCDDYEYDWKRNTVEYIPYEDEQGKERHHYPDFIVYRDGIKYFFETKGEHLLNDNFQINGQKCYTIRKWKASTKLYGDRYILISMDGIVEFYETGWVNEDIIRFD